MDVERAQAWVLKHFHPQGLRCPQCQASVEEARHFQRTQTSGLQVYCCKSCEGVYNLYSGTVFAGTQFRPSQVVLLLRGICQGVSSAQPGSFNCRFLVSYFSHMLILQISRSRVTFHATSAILHLKSQQVFEVNHDKKFLLPLT